MRTESLICYNYIRNRNGCTEAHLLYINLFEENIIIRMQGLFYVLCKHISDSILHAPTKLNQ